MPITVEQARRKLVYFVNGLAETQETIDRVDLIQLTEYSMALEYIDARREKQASASDINAFIKAALDSTSTILPIERAYHDAADQIFPNIYIDLQYTNV